MEQIENVLYQRKNNVTDVTLTTVGETAITSVGCNKFNC